MYKLYYDNDEMMKVISNARRTQGYYTVENGSYIILFNEINDKLYYHYNRNKFQWERLDPPQSLLKDLFNIGG